MQIHPIWNHDTGERLGVVDIEALTLPNGDKAHLLDQRDLFRELSGLGVTGITMNSGRHELLIAYGRWQIEQKKVAV